jgi:ATP-dependent DNA ligase
VLVPYKERDFAAYFEAYTSKGGEGVVIKNPESIYHSHRSSRKVDFWKRCKRTVTEDYVLMHIERTPKNQLTGAWGLYCDGKLLRVFRAMVPKHLLTTANCETLVAEFRGWGMNEDRVLRHASFVRVRTDKLPKSCTF